MRKIESAMLRGIRDSRPVSHGNTKVLITGDWIGEVTLFGNTIATFDRGFVTLTDGGWRTATTKSRLNALLFGTGYCVSATNGEWRLCFDGFDAGAFQNGTAFYVGGGRA